MSPHDDYAHDMHRAANRREARAKPPPAEEQAHKRKDFVPESVSEAYNHINDALSWLAENEGRARAVPDKDLRCTSRKKFKNVYEEELILRCSELVNHGQHRNSGLRWTDEEADEVEQPEPEGGG